MNLLTASRLKLARTCPRAHHHRYEEGLVSVGPEPLATAFGTAVHSALESWWRAWQTAEGYGALDGAMVALANAATHAEVEGSPLADPFVEARAAAMIIAYDARWTRWAAGVQVIGVEVPFRAPLVHPVLGESARTWEVSGKIDLLVQLADGRVALIDHKTTAGDARSGSDYARRLTLDPQVSTYFMGATVLGHPADLALWDVLKKPDVRPLLATPEEQRTYTQERSKACRECAKKKPAPGPHTDKETGLSCSGGRIVTDAGGRLHAGQRTRDETPGEYHDRCLADLAGVESDGTPDGTDGGPEASLSHIPVVRQPWEVEAHGWALWHTVRAIEETRAAVTKAKGDVRAVPQNTDACLKYGSPCAYLPLCEGTANARDPGMYRRLPVIHPELPGEMQAPAPVKPQRAA